MLLDTPISRLQAEDIDGWFGVAPGRADLIAVLPPGLLVFSDPVGEGFVALAGGVLDLDAGRCRVMTHRAALSRDLDSLAADLEQVLRQRRAKHDARTSALNDLIREALQRLAREERA